MKTEPSARAPSAVEVQPPTPGRPDAETLPAPAPATPPTLNPSRTIATEVFERMSPSGVDAFRSAGRDIIPRKQVTFELMGSECAPGVYQNPDGTYYSIRVTLRSLSSAEELTAMAGVTSGGEVPFRMAKLTLYAINDQVLTPELRDFHWECFGMQGRQLAMSAYHLIGSAGEAALGKALATFTRS